MLVIIAVAARCRRMRLFLPGRPDIGRTRWKIALQPGEDHARRPSAVGRAGHPQLRRPDGTEVWSYAKHAQQQRITAALLYTSAKEGDQGTFLDLKFVGRQAGVMERGSAHDAAEGRATGIRSRYRRRADRQRARNRRPARSTISCDKIVAAYATLLLGRIIASSLSASCLIERRVVETDGRLERVAFSAIMILTEYFGVENCKRARESAD